MRLWSHGQAVPRQQACLKRLGVTTGYRNVIFVLPGANEQEVIYSRGWVARKPAIEICS